MADPTKYTPAYSYSGWQASNPSRPLPADEVDNDFANVSRSVNQTIDALKDVRRSDGKLKNQSVGPDQLSPALTIGFTFTGLWFDGASYSAGDGVVYEDTFYSARTAHTADVSNAPGNTAYWNELYSLADIVVTGGMSLPRDSFVGDGATAAFTLSFVPLSKFNVFVQVGGVVQTTDAYSTNGNTLTFVSPPPNGYGIEVRGFATTAALVTPEDGSVTTVKLADLSVTTPKLADEAVTTGKLANDVTAKLPELVPDTVPVDNAAGTAREQKTFAEFRSLLGLPWLLETAVQTFAGLLNFPVPAYLSLSSRLIQDVANGLEITPFHFFTGNLQTDNRVALQEAVDYTFDNFSVPGLNLCGRNWTIGGPVLRTDKPQAHRKIHNGRVSALATFTGGWLLDFRVQGEDTPNNRIDGLTVRLSYNCGGPSAGQEYAEGGLALRNTQGVTVEGGDLQYFSGYGIYDETARAACEVRVNMRITGRGPNSEGVRFSGNDSEICGGFIRNCKRGFTFLSGSNHLMNTHLYNNSDCAGLWLGSMGRVVNNQFDEDVLRFREFRHGTFTGNRFNTTGPADSMITEGGFIIIEPQSAGIVVEDVTMTGNNFYNVDSTVTKMIAVNTSAGSIGAVRRTSIDNNAVSSSVTRQSTKPRGRSAAIATASTGTVDLSAQIPFGSIKHATAAWSRDTASAARPAIMTHMDGFPGGVVSFDLSTAASGRAYVEADINDNYGSA
jgi:hypothetical protein